MEATNPRKRIELSVEAMKQLVDNKFSIPKIAAYFNVSVKTVKRRMKEAGISVSQEKYQNYVTFYMLSNVAY